MPGPQTRAQMRTLVLRELQDPSGIYFTAALVNDVLNDVMGVFVEKTGLRRASANINVVGGDPVVNLATLSPPVVRVTRVALPSGETATDEIKLIKVDEEELEDMDLNWRNRDGRPTHYMRWNQGFKALRLYPNPSTAFTAWLDQDAKASFDSMLGLVNGLEGVNGTFDSLYGTMTGLNTYLGGCRVDYVAGSTPMTDDADTPYTKSGVPDEHHYAIWRGAVGVCLKMETALKQLERAATYITELDNEIAAAKTGVKEDFQDKPIESVEYSEL